MPYIEKAVRASLQDGRKAMTAGELNYFITKELHDYLNRRTMTYTTLNEVVGVLECAKLEFYRMLAAPYEDNKRYLNGDIE